MRALGPGSVSSILKIILDVVFVALVIGVAVLALSTLASLAMLADPSLMSPAAEADLKAQGVAGAGLTLGLAAAGLYIAGVLIIAGQLRRIFATLTAGDPFHPTNVRRLRLIGGMLGLLELGRYPLAVVAAWIAPRDAAAHPGFNPTAWFAVLVVFVLAEVFREGARLRREAELTI
jgi:hypothetical protein